MLRIMTALAVWLLATLATPKPRTAPAVDVRLIGVPEVALRLDITEREVWNQLADGSIPSVKLGRRRLVRSDALDAFIDSLTDAAS